MILEGERVENTPEAWSRRATLGETPWEAAGWSETGQRTRMGWTLAYLRPRAHDVLLDYGCGPGALVDLLPPGVRYVGYDWSSGMVERARRDHPDFPFDVREPSGAVDLIACIGTFNLPGSKDKTWSVLARLWHSYAPRMMAVSLYAGADARCLIYEIDETLAAAREFADNVQVWPIMLNDILLVVKQ